MLPANLQDEFIQRRPGQQGYYFYFPACHLSSGETCTCPDKTHSQNKLHPHKTLSVRGGVILSFTQKPI